MPASQVLPARGYVSIRRAHDGERPLGAEELPEGRTIASEGGYCRLEQRLEIARVAPARRDLTVGPQRIEQLRLCVVRRDKVDEAARGLATRMMAASPKTADRLDFAYHAVLSRKPSPDEVAIVAGYYQKQLTKYKAAPAEAAKAIRFGDSKPPGGLDEVDLAAWTLVANLILNLDENIVRN